MKTLNKTAKITEAKVGEPLANTGRFISDTILPVLEEGEKHFWILRSETKFQATISNETLSAFPNGAIGILTRLDMVNGKPVKNRSGWIEIFPVGSAESRHLKLEESEYDKIVQLTELAEELQDEKINNIIAEKIATMLAEIYMMAIHLD